MADPNDNLPPQPDFGAPVERLHDIMDTAPGPDPKPTVTQEPRVSRENPAHSESAAASPSRKPFVPFKKGTDEIDFLKYISIIFRRRRIVLIALVAFMFIGFVKSLGKVDMYQAETKLLVQLRQQNPVGQFDPGYFWDRQTKINTMLNIIKSREVMRRVINRLHMHITEDALVARVKAERVAETNLLRVSALSEVPDEAALVANTLAQVFVDFNAELNRKDIADGLAYIDRQLAKTEKELKEREDALRGFQESNRMVESQEGSTAEVDKLSEMETQMRNATLQIVENDERLNRLQKLLRDLKVFVEESYSFDNTLETQLIQLNVELANSLAKYGERHPQIMQIKEKIRQVKELSRKNREGNIKITSTKSLNQERSTLLQEYNGLMVDNQALRAKKTALDQVLLEMISKVGQLPSIQLQFHRIKRDKQNIEQVYQLLKTKQQEQRIRYEMQSADIVQQDPAQIPHAPIQQGSKYGFLVILLVGLIIGTGLAFAVEFFDQTVKNPQNLEEDLGLPILGVIPLIEEDSKVIDIESKSSILEPYRSLRTNIRYTNMGATKRTLLVTSAIQGDGKTTKVCNLAISFAMEGRTVMIIDADLRRASVHKVMGVEKENGLSEYLTGQATIEQVSKKVFNDMISVVSSGKRPPNPAELLGNSKFLDIIRDGLKTHDIVLVDSPAIVPVSDALLLAPHIDATIIIGRAFKTPLKAMQFTKNSLVRAGANIIGIVYNGVEQRKGYYPYYYSYYSYYSYYKSRYYYYDDDEEMDKLPKNFREFALFTLRQIGKDLYLNLRNTRRMLVKAVTRPTFTRTRKVLVLLGGVALLVGAVCWFGNLILNPKKPSGLVPEQYRYLPYYPAGTQDSGKERGPDSEAAADSIQIQTAVARNFGNWLKAWQSVNIYAYQTYYSKESFQWLHGGYNEWIAFKDSTFKQSPPSRIRVDSVSFTLLTDSLVTLRFIQEYSSDTTQPAGRFVKEIEWRNEYGDWKIIREGRSE